MVYKAAVVGTGDPATADNSERVGIGHIHGGAYHHHERCELAACADVRLDRAKTFADEFDIDDQCVYESARSLLKEQQIDIVSVCVPPAQHAEIVDIAIREGMPAIHCEKPIATTWGECLTMAESAAERGTQLTINHQRRFGTPFQKVKKLLDDGRIGELTRIEFSANNLYDYGTHSFDLCDYYVDGSQPEWVFGQIQYTEKNVLFGEHNENQAVVTWEYENGVSGLATTSQYLEHDIVGCHHRLIGTRGRIELGPNLETGAHYPQQSAGPVIRLLSEDTVRDIAVDGYLHDLAHAVRSTLFAVDGLDGRSPLPHSIENAMRATSLIFGAYESARQRQRIEFPLEIRDNPLESMMSDGALLSH